MSVIKTRIGNAPLQRAAVIAAAITGFMLLFRPFGMTINDPATLLVVLGFAPLNFIAMTLVHIMPSRGGWLGAAQRIGAISFANISYISLLAGKSADAATSVKVALVTLLVVAAVGLWNRERSLRREVLELRAPPATPEQEIVVLRGEGDKEILRLPPHALHYVRANGNYVDVHFLKGDAPETSLLRATLAGIMDQMPEGALVQCHRSYLANLGAARRLISAGGNMEIEFPDGGQIPVSRSYRKAIRTAAVN